MKFKIMFNPYHSHVESGHSHEYDASETGYDKLFMDIEDCINNPPATWSKYNDSNSKHMDIIQMELIEMQTAYSNMKMSVGTHKEYLRQLKHLASAVTMTLHDMSCKYKD